MGGIVIDTFVIRFKVGSLIYIFILYIFSSLKNYLAWLQYLHAILLKVTNVANATDRMVLSISKNATFHFVY